MPRFIFHVIKTIPVSIEGHIYIDAPSKKKARKALRFYGSYHIKSIKVSD